MADFAFRKSIKDDVWASRGHARAASNTLKQQGHKASVEASGPSGGKEFRVRVQHPEDKESVAYFHEDDRLDNYKPHWITK